MSEGICFEDVHTRLPGFCRILIVRASSEEILPIRTVFFIGCAPVQAQQLSTLP